MTKLSPKIISLFSLALVMAVAPLRMAAQNFDTSGTAGLSGRYFFRYVNFFNDSQGNLVESCSLTGVMNFDGKGSYTLSNTQLFDAYGSNGSGFCASLGSGKYGVQSNGIAQLDNPLFAATLFGAFSKPVLTASSTEDAYYDLFIAIQAPSQSLSNGSLSGNFTVGTLDFLDVVANSVGFAREGWFTISADGHGNIQPFSVTGALGQSGSVSESVSASTYALSGTNGGTLTFPGAAGDPNQILSGSRTLYVSADGNYILAGSTSGTDMIFGFRANSGSTSASSFYGTYFTAGMDADVSGACSSQILYCLDNFYGSINTNGNGNLIWHERFDDVVDIFTSDSTFAVAVPSGSSPPFDGIFYYLAGAGGQAFMSIGSGTQFSLEIGIRAPAVSPDTKVWISPTGIIHAANFTPITNAYAPGEMVSLYGSFGVATLQDQALPVPMELGGVRVLVNGHPAPILFVSARQINAIIPYEVAGDYFDGFQVIANRTPSNVVTVYADYSAPGIFTMDQSGIGPGAVLHSNGKNVTDNDPAVPGETVAVYMTGLGTVTPSLKDGEAAPSQPLSTSDEFTNQEIAVLLDDGTNFPQVSVSFAGLAPQFAGLYQLNFALPRSGLLNGDDFIFLATNEGVNEMATIAVSGFSGGIAASKAGRFRNPRRDAIRFGRTRPKAHAKSQRRGLPETAR